MFALAGIMLFSSVGTALVLLTQDDDPAEISNIINESDLNAESQDVENPLDTPSTDEPQAFIPQGDITELQVTDTKEGEGQAVASGDTITVHYHGTLASDGTVFDSSYRRGQPISFPLGNVIAGWQEGIPGMKVGGKRRLVIPSDKAYGAVGSPPAIGPNADLVFEVELISIDS